MWFNKIKIRQSDRLWTQYMKLKYKNLCAICGRIHPQGSKGLGVSHFFNRRKESVRYNEDNCILACNIPCHAEWEHEKKEGRAYYSFMLNKLGENGFNRLKILANTIGKRDDKLQVIRIKQMIKELI